MDPRANSKVATDCVAATIHHQHVVNSSLAKLKITYYQRRIRGTTQVLPHEPPLIAQRLRPGRRDSKRHVGCSENNLIARLTGNGRRWPRHMVATGANERGCPIGGIIAEFARRFPLQGEAIA